MSSFTDLEGELSIWVLQEWDLIIHITHKPWNWVERQVNSYIVIAHFSFRDLYVQSMHLFCIWAESISLKHELLHERIFMMHGIATMGFN